MKILVVSSYLPFPLYSGGHIRLYNLLERLSKNHEITLVCERRSYQTKQDVEEVEKVCKKLFVIQRKKQWSLSTVLKAGLSFNSFLAEGHTLPEMKKKISELLKNEKFDLIHSETFYVAQNIPQTNIPIVVVEHNIEYLVYKRFAQNARVIVKPFVYADILKIKLNEEGVWRRANAVIAVSDIDKKVIYNFNKNVYVIANGVDLSQFKIQNPKLKIDKKEKTILYIGDFKWVQNRDAVRLILEKIWLELQLKMKNRKWKIKLWIVGKNIPKNLKQLGDENVVFDEDATDNTSEIFLKADILLAPIRVGGGTSYKILEAMASGVPVVTTTLGAVGINAVHEKEVVVANSEDEMISGVRKLLTDESLYYSITKSARELIEKDFNWDKIALELEGIYQKTR